MAYQINGEEPKIVGRKCVGLYIIQYQERDVVTDPENTAYLKFDSSWYKLCFDGGTIFWRENEIPSEPINSNICSCLVLLNLSELDGIVGNTLEKLEYRGCDEIISAKFSFSGGRQLEFCHSCYDDFTSINW